MGQGTSTEQGGETQPSPLSPTHSFLCPPSPQTQQTHRQKHPAVHAQSCASTTKHFCMSFLQNTILLLPFDPHTYHTSLFKNTKATPPQKTPNKQTNPCQKKPHQNKAKNKINKYPKKEKTELLICSCLKSKFNDLLKF